MRKTARYFSVSGNPAVNGKKAELNFVTDPAKNDIDVVVEMTLEELERLSRRILQRLHHHKPDKS